MDLLKCLPEEDQEHIKNINSFSVKHIYNYRSVVEIEIAGFNIIGGLLREFVDAVLFPRSARAEKLLQLIPTHSLSLRGKENTSILTFSRWWILFRV